MSTGEESIEKEASSTIEAACAVSTKTDQEELSCTSNATSPHENDEIIVKDETIKLTTDKNNKSTLPQTTDNDFYLIKWVEFNFESLPILLQNANGPCPLLAIFNILLLRKNIVLNRNMDAISTSRVLALLAEYILEKDVANLSDEERANYEHNVQDTLAVLDKLKTGLDVNLKFDGVDQFEYTRECIIFDLCNIHLYHGWIIDPQDTTLRKIIGKNGSSYNQLVEKMISQRHSNDDELLRESFLIEQFLDENSSQLTHYGILELNQTVRENQMAVFFRNNHFSTIWKNQRQILVLVSDQGYLDHRSIVFETLTDVDNDTQFTDGYGKIWKKPSPVDSSKDRELAMAMQDEEERQYHQAQLEQQKGKQQSQHSEHPHHPKKNKTRPKKHPDHEGEKSCVVS